MRRRHPLIARLAVLAALVPTLVSIGASRADATTPDWLAEANYLRTFWNVSVPTLTEDPTLSANDQAHDNYLDHNNTCGHTEDVNNPYYTAAGAYGGSHSVVYCAALGPVNDVDGWSRTPLHGEQVLNPQLTVTGFAETSLNGGHAAMDTLTNASGAAAPAGFATWPNGTGFPFSHFAGGEIDYNGGDAVVDNCGSPYSDNQAALGAPIFVDLPGAAHHAVPASASDYFLKDNNGTAIPVCLFDATSPVAPSMSTAVMLPLTAFKPLTHYTAQYKAGGYTATWSFTTRAAAPGPPTNAHVTGSGDHSATVSWTAPSDNGGAAITGYHLQQYDVDAANPGWVDATSNTESSPATSGTVTGLINGHRYFFWVAAKNSSGTGAYSAYTDNIATPGPTAPTKPGAPTGVTGVAGDSKVTVSWTAPGDNGGAAVTGYDVQYSTNDGGSWTSASAAFHTSTATTHDVTGLTNGTAYKFRVAAINSVGTGGYSAKSAAYTPTSGATAPGKPTGVSGIAGNTKVMLSWTAPASDGGSAIQGYHVQYSYNGGTSWINGSSAFYTSTATTQDITGLTNGTAYIFRVAAINDVNTGAYSDGSSPVTPTSGTGPTETTVFATGTRSEMPYGADVDLIAVLQEAATSTAIEGASVQLMKRERSSDPWVAFGAPVITNAAGIASVRDTPPHNSQYEWVYTGDSDHAAATSSVVSEGVRQLVSAKAKDRTVRKGKKVVVKGKVLPAGDGGVQLQVKRHGDWNDVHKPAALSANGGYVIKFKAGKKGKHTYRVHRDATADNTAGNSKAVHVKVT
ncbi:MAG: fibronectin type III domain-containing protein [Frankiaceae bacterium]|nr:fibronectin type III domain-containing protein [Frankiaceae bacterium]MBV9872507.1 fibronectin type III domain-containing protein [Frankiaceae bacterium]